MNSQMKQISRMRHVKRGTKFPHSLWPYTPPETSPNLSFWGFVLLWRTIVQTSVITPLTTGYPQTLGVELKAPALLLPLSFCDLPPVLKLPRGLQPPVITMHKRRFTSKVPRIWGIVSQETRMKTKYIFHNITGGNQGFHVPQVILKLRTNVV